MAIVTHEADGTRRANVGLFAPLIRRIDAAYSYQGRSISRPKLLLTISLLDAAIIIASGFFAYALESPDVTSLGTIGLWTALVALSTVFALRRNWSYSIHALRQPTAQLNKILRSIVAVFCLVAGASYMLETQAFSPATGGVWLTIAVAALASSRLLIAWIVDALTDAGRLVRRTVIVGGGPDAEHLIASLESGDHKEIAVLGVFDDRADERSAESVAGYPKLGTIDQLPEFSHKEAIDLVVVTVPMAAEQRLMQILKKLFSLPVDIRISALNSKLRLSSSAYSYVGRVPMLTLMDRPLTDWDRVIKNIEDRVLGALLLLLAAPVMALVALAIRLDSRGPIFFKQRRYGFNNELIEVYKFRSMYTDMSDAKAAKLVTRDDPRVTRVGRFIRKTSLDELPQLFNVIKGDMSLVGPRPHATEAKASSDLYQEVVGEYFSRHRMKPGVTGWAQINGWRGETDTHEKIQRRVESDLYYIENWSLFFDLYIIAATPFALLTGKNAY